MDPVALGSSRPSLLDDGRVGVVVVIAAVALAYFAAATASLRIAIPPGHASPLWMPAGIALAACLGFGVRVWPGILLGAAAANFGVMATPVLAALAIGAGNTLAAVLACLLMQRFAGVRHRFDSARQVRAFAVVALAAPLPAASVGVAALALAGKVGWTAVPGQWLTWWLGDAAGILILTPLLLSWCGARGARAGSRGPGDGWMFAALLAAGCALIAAMQPEQDGIAALLFLALPLVVWAATRVGQRAVTAAGFAISMVALVDMLDGRSALFAALSLERALNVTQLLIAAIALTGLALATHIDALRRAGGGQGASRAGDAAGDESDGAPPSRAFERDSEGIRDEERWRIARALHDGAAQHLAAALVGLARARGALRSGGPDEVEAALDAAMEDATRAGRALRIEIGDRLPDMPEDEPLSAALRRLAGAFEARSGVRAEVSTSPALDAPPLRVRRALLSIAGEALANASRHAAAGLVRVGLRDDAGGICLTIEDDGRGFSVDRDAPVPSGASYGLQIMRESARAAGARFEIESAPGRGTRISVRAPRAETPGR